MWGANYTNNNKFHFLFESFKRVFITILKYKEISPLWACIGGGFCGDFLDLFFKRNVLWNHRTTTTMWYYFFDTFICIAENSFVKLEQLTSIHCLHIWISVIRAGKFLAGSEMKHEIWPKQRSYIHPLEHNLIECQVQYRINSTRTVFRRWEKKKSRFMSISRFCLYIF